MASESQLLLAAQRPERGDFHDLEVRLARFGAWLTDLAPHAQVCPGYEEHGHDEDHDEDVVAARPPREVAPRRLLNE